MDNIFKYGLDSNFEYSKATGTINIKLGEEDLEYDK